MAAAEHQRVILFYTGEIELVGLLLPFVEAELTLVESIDVGETSERVGVEVQGNHGQQDRDGDRKPDLEIETVAHGLAVPVKRGSPCDEKKLSIDDFGERLLFSMNLLLFLAKQYDEKCCDPTVFQ